MKPSFTSVFWPTSEAEVAGAAEQLRDYCQIGMDLVLQRQVIYLAALGLAAYFYDIRLAVTLLILVVLSEIFDYWVFRSVLKRSDWDRKRVHKALILIFLSTLLSAGIIVS